MSYIRPATGATFSGKMNKSDVRYRSSESCRSCDYFQGSKCQIIEGGIAPDYMCDKWVVNSAPSGKFADFYMDEYKKAKNKE